MILNDLELLNEMKELKVELNKFTDLSIIEFLRIPKVDSNSLAILAPNRTPLTYFQLFREIDQIEETLRSNGIKKTTRVAVLLPNGPELAVIILAVMKTAICIPLNIVAHIDATTSLLDELGIDALITLRDNTPIRKIVTTKGIPLFDLVIHTNEAAGKCRILSSNNPRSSESANLPQKKDVALVLYTSGITSKPKVVPLSHENLILCAQYTVKAFDLTSADRCLNVMPLHHLHAIAAPLLGTIAAGGSVICPAGFYAPYFFKWMAEMAPTWYSAVPAIHQSILEGAGLNMDIIHHHRLRFIRSASASLPVQVLHQLEKVFSTPVIECFAMTECSPITCNPMPPKRRKPGSVGLAAGPKIKIIDEYGHALPPLKTGQICIFGSNLTQGYENDPVTNNTSFINGWLKTGDIGYQDHEGFLFIVGRSKEIINRGGEKISPAEIENVLLSHHLVTEAVVFPVPDAILGEEIACAVVIKSPNDINESALQKFMEERLAFGRVPRYFWIVPNIPKTATGKIQRLRMAERLGIKNEKILKEVAKNITGPTAVRFIYIKSKVS